MVKVEAIKSMQNGEKVTHRFFSAEEWVTMDKDGYIVTEEGYISYPECFWAYRYEPEWNDGWSIFSPIQSETEVSEG